MPRDIDRNDEAGVPAAAPGPPSPTTDDELVDRHVLIVEDEPRLRQMLIRAIAEMEFVPSGVPTAEAATRELEGSRRGILLVDLNLPGMPGIELCELVRRRWPDTQMVILTGHGDLEAARTAMHLDVVDFLTKPCSLGELESSLDRALRRRRNRIVVRALPRMRHDGIDGIDGIDDMDDVGVDDADETAAERADDSAKSGDRAHAPPPTLHDLERRHILAALDRHDGNRAATAEELGISLRTLYYRLKAYGRHE